jgi:glutathione S-transferase
MRLYHHPQSTNARRAVMTAVHLGTPVELVMVDFAKGEHRQPQFLKLNLKFPPCP